MKFLAFCPAVVVLALLFTNLVTGYIFYLNENHVYTRGNGMIWLYGCAGIYLLYGIVYLFQYRKVFRKRNLISLSVVFVAVISATIMQYFYPDLLLEMFFISIGMLFISLIIQRPEERVNVVTGLNKMTAYMDDMKRALYNRKPMRIIMVNR